MHFANLDIAVLEADTVLTGCKYLQQVEGRGYKQHTMTSSLRQSTKDIGGNTVVLAKPELEDVGLEGAPHALRGYAYVCQQK
jgi:hypothetical protein